MIKSQVLPDNWSLSTKLGWSRSSRAAAVVQGTLHNVLRTSSLFLRQMSRTYVFLLQGQNAAAEHHQDQALPLEPLILLLSPDAGSCELFDVTNESMDYEELGHYVNILSVALVDIAPYVTEERAIMKSAGTSVQGSPNKFKKLPAPPLELLRKVLEVLQSKIGTCSLCIAMEYHMNLVIPVDTRAAHLDRSRTKAAIQRLTLRVCYDRMALIGVRPRRRASTLKAYFSPQRK